jgi:hypothetical protein
MKKRAPEGARQSPPQDGLHDSNADQAQERSTFDLRTRCALGHEVHGDGSRIYRCIRCHRSYRDGSVSLLEVAS